MKTLISISFLLTCFSSFFGLIQYLLMGSVVYPTGYILFAYPFFLLIYILFCLDKKEILSQIKNNKVIFIFCLLFLFFALLSMVLNHSIVPLKSALISFFVSYFYLVIALVLFFCRKVSLKGTFFSRWVVILTVIGALVGVVHLLFNSPLCINSVKLIVYPDYFVIWNHTIPEGLSASKSYFFATVSFLAVLILNSLYISFSKGKKISLFFLLLLFAILFFVYKANDRISIIILFLSLLNYILYRLWVKIIKYLPIFYFLAFLIIILFFMFNMKTFINSDSYMNTKSLFGRYNEWGNVLSTLKNNKNKIPLGYSITQGYDQGNDIKIKEFNNLKMFGQNKNDAIITSKIGWENEDTNFYQATSPTVYTYRGIVIDNQYLSILLQGGFLSLICYIIFVILFSCYAVRYLMQNNKKFDNPLPIAFCCVLLVYPTAMILENVGAIFFLFCCGFLMLKKEI